MRNFFADYRRVIGFLFVTAAFSVSAFAQNYTEPTKNTTVDKSADQDTTNVRNDKNEFSVWAAYAPDIPRLFSGSRHSTFGEIGFQYARRHRNRP